MMMTHSSPQRILDNSSASPDHRAITTTSSASAVTSPFYHPSMSMDQLHSIIDDNANEFSKVFRVLEALHQENVMLRREVAILKTPTKCYEAVFANGLTSNNNDSGSTNDPVIDAISVQRCGARIRATEEAIVESNKQGQIMSMRVRELEQQLKLSQEAERCLRKKVDEVTQTSLEQTAAINELATRCDAKDLLIQKHENTIHSMRSASDELDQIVLHLRRSLAAAADQLALADADRHHRETALLDMKKLQAENEECRSDLRIATQELRHLKSCLDQARVRVVQLEMRLEKEHP